MPETNYTELERELAGAQSDLPLHTDADEVSKWSEYLDDESDVGDEYDDYQPRRA